MCTVSYLPLEDGRYLLSSNRDESPGRNAIEIVREKRDGLQVIYPRDPGAGGTWFCCTDSGMAMCLLNGARRTKIPGSGFRHSRGLIPQAVLEFDDPQRFVKEYSFEGIADFTLVICTGQHIYEILWDGTAPSLTELPNVKPHFWSSVTLYPEPVRQMRNELFDQWLKETPEYTQEKIIHFHKYGGSGDPENDFVMNRANIVKTLSISSVMYEGDHLYFLHEDLENGKLNIERLPLQSNTHFADQS